MVAGTVVLGLGTALNGLGWLVAAGTTLRGAGMTCKGVWMITANSIKILWARTAAMLNGVNYNENSDFHKNSVTYLDSGIQLAGKGLFFMLLGSISIVAAHNLLGPKPVIYDKILGFFGLSVSYPKWA